MEGKIAVVGKSDQILPFSAIGIEVYNAETLGDAERIVEKLAEKKYALIMITEDFAGDMMDIRMKYAPTPIPTIIN